MKEFTRSRGRAKEVRHQYLVQAFKKEYEPNQLKRLFAARCNNIFANESKYTNDQPLDIKNLQNQKNKTNT
jgi:hypothetical protein